jgi:hypothetical protein
MFVYFPEYIYNKTKTFFKYTFANNINKDSARDLLKNKLKEENYLEILREYKNQKINFPKLNFRHCNSFPINETKVNLGLISSYDKIENEILICSNYVNSIKDLSSILDKELAYALEINSPLMQKKLTLNDYTSFSIKACKRMLSNNSEMELVKRCAYLDLKYRHYYLIKSTYEEECENMDNLKLNEVVKKLVEINLNN